MFSFKQWLPDLEIKRIQLRYLTNLFRLLFHVVVKCWHHFCLNKDSFARIRGFFFNIMKLKLTLANTLHYFFSFNRQRPKYCWACWKHTEDFGLTRQLSGNTEVLFQDLANNLKVWQSQNCLWTIWSRDREKTSKRWHVSSFSSHTHMYSRFC